MPGNSINLNDYDSFVHLEISTSATSDGEVWENRLGLGSGAIIKSDLNSTLVLTAAHVCVPQSLDANSENNVMSLITATTWHDEKFFLTIAGIDMVNDLCMLETDFTGLPYVRISRILPTPGDDVYNLAAPYGIFGNKFVLSFKGTYSGKIIDDDEQVYTLPAAPGSSGSPVLNSRGHLIGIIHSSTSVMETIAIGPSTEATLEFVSGF
jgi:S1-C subfamily serine protease